MNKVLIILLSACVIGAGCGKKASEKIAEKMIEKSMEKDGIKGDVNISGGNVTIHTTDKDGKKTDVNVSGDKMTVKSDDGNAVFTTGSSAKLPDNFPKDVYVPAGANIATAMTVPEGFSVALQTKESAEKIVTACKAKMVENGWKEEAAYTAAQQTVIAFKKDNRTASVMIMGADGATQINLTVVTEKQ
ncbi:MAG: hypothetical protein A2283_20425 [Lentisphaerae bacterium RIFOXYA12_FULL_48_11]|nr:MAG: hypothetical protein A2283_20425 [Lentisphaerae bacterium RIFOXYA12_FULL_48_11]